MTKHPFIKMEYENISFLLDKDKFSPDSGVVTKENKHINLQEKLNSIFKIDNSGGDEMYLHYRDGLNSYSLKISTIVSVERVDLKQIKPMPKLLRESFLKKGILGLDINDIKHPTYLLDIENLLKGGE